MPFSSCCNYFQWAALVLVAPAFGIQAQTGTPSTASAPTSRSRSEAVAAKLDAIRVKTKVPALAGAIVTSEGLEAVWEEGVRAAGKDAPVATSDSWHLGSCTESMTATLIALLVERGDLQWEKLRSALGAQSHREQRDVVLGVSTPHLLRKGPPLRRTEQRGRRGWCGAGRRRDWTQGTRSRKENG